MRIQALILSALFAASLAQDAQAACGGRAQRWLSRCAEWVTRSAGGLTSRRGAAPNAPKERVESPQWFESMWDRLNKQPRSPHISDGIYEAFYRNTQLHTVNSEMEGTTVSNKFRRATFFSWVPDELLALQVAYPDSQELKNVLTRMRESKNLLTIQRAAEYGFADATFTASERADVIEIMKGQAAFWQGLPYNKQTYLDLRDFFDKVQVLDDPMVSEFQFLAQNQFYELVPLLNKLSWFTQVAQQKENLLFWLQFQQLVLATKHTITGQQ